MKEQNNPASSLRRSIRQHWIMGSLVVAVCFFGTGIWASFAELSSAAIAAGKVSPDGSLRVVQHLLLLEREEQLQILDEVRLSISRSGGRIVFVAGEAGIGKSSLIADFLSSLGPETRKVIGLCDPLITPRPLGPIRDIAAGLSGSTQIRDEEAMLFGGLVEHLASLREPVVLVIEDLHWRTIAHWTG
ncbi:AAA family ATPase [Roseibium aggregatum]|uniref:AAA family ATPase n=1 Tax=Roseibium aggregatum TaxID=187304 RepID=UPI001E4A9CFA|nr:ATP-binding protein [Roseibium aggregatum]UES47924.1 AAA family ATPase [Roseibium aggregatum]